MVVVVVEFANYFAVITVAMFVASLFAEVRIVAQIAMPIDLLSLFAVVINLVAVDSTEMKKFLVVHSVVGKSSVPVPIDLVVVETVITPSALDLMTEVASRQMDDVEVGFVKSIDFARIAMLAVPMRFLG